jgi:hypothetical protein
MIRVFPALAGLALLAPTSVMAHPLSPVPVQSATKKVAPKKAPAKKPAAKKPTAKKTAAKATVPAIVPSADAARVADWIAGSRDNHGLPYVIVDKNNAALLLFDAKGKAIAAVPVLIGIAPGDDATPGVGSKNLAEIGPAEKTTPAGRFLAKFGLAVGKAKVLWVDYTNSVALHPIPPAANKKEHRRERLLSPTPEDNRITFGCINVPSAFYTQNLSPMFRRKGGYVYVMPDTKPVEEVFPQLRVQAVMNGTAS